MAPKTFKPADLNKDGEVTPRERRKYREKKAAEPDRLSSEELAADYGMVYRLFQSDNELMTLLQEATNQQWEKPLFEARLRETQWYQNNNEYARDYLTRKALGGADWEASLEDAQALVQQRATASGARLSQQEVDQYADQVLMNGWDRAGRTAMLDRALAEKISAAESGMLRGEAGNLQDQLRALAQMNGIRLSESYYESAARSVAGGLTTDDDWIREVRDQAASLWPSWSDKIKAGVNARELASGYINVMADTFEILPDQISLDDPDLRQAMTGVDDKGNPKPMGLFDFQQKLRKDPRWMNTKQAEDQMTGIANEVLRMFGFVG